MIYHHLEEYVASQLRQVSSTVLLVCPFIRFQPLARLISNLPAGVKCIVITRWQMQDFAHGSSDADVYVYCENSGIRLLRNSRIHLKLWMLDDQLMIPTSANVSERALGTQSDHNWEFMLPALPIDVATRTTIDLIKRQSSLVTRDDYLAAKATEEDGASHTGEVLDEALPHDKCLLADIPAAESPLHLWQQYAAQLSGVANGGSRDLAAMHMPPGLDERGFVAVAHKHLFSLPVVRVVLEQLANEPMRFGQVRAFLHDRCCDAEYMNPEATATAVDRLYNWVVGLGANAIEIRRLPYSEIMLLKADRMGLPPHKALGIRASKPDAQPRVDRGGE